MTDDRIAELLGRPKRLAHRDSSLMHRIRIVVAEAQAEGMSMEADHIYRLREQIARDTAQIERMRAALVAARAIFAIDRDAFAECCRSPVEPHYDDNDAAYLAGMDAVLRQIDAAMGEANEPR